MKAELKREMLGGKYKCIVYGYGHNEIRTSEWRATKAEALMDLAEMVVLVQKAAQSLYDRENVVDMQASVEAKG